MRYLDVEGVGRVSRIGLGTWQFGSREWGYGDAYAGGAALFFLRPVPAPTFYTRVTRPSG